MICPEMTLLESPSSKWLVYVTVTRVCSDQDFLFFNRDLEIPILVLMICFSKKITFVWSFYKFPMLIPCDYRKHLDILDCDIAYPNALTVWETCQIRKQELTAQSDTQYISHLAPAEVKYLSVIDGTWQVYLSHMEVLWRIEIFPGRKGNKWDLLKALEANQKRTLCLERTLQKSSSGKMVHSDQTWNYKLWSF